MKQVRIVIYLPENVAAIFDTLRGKESRSAFGAKIIRSFIASWAKGES